MTDFLRRRSGIGTTAVLAWLTGSSLLAAQPNTGSITGRVHGLGTAKTLSGALVQVKGTALVASTDIAGTFRIDRAPAGRQTLLVTYLGFDPASIEVQVVAGQTVRQDIQLRPAAQYYETVTVSETFLEGQARALNQQKNAINIKNIVSADQVGRFPDANSAEAAQRIPGVSIQRDQGEGRFVLIRGMEPRLSTTSINGAAVPAPEGDIRYVALDVIPADLLEVAVTKTITPDMDSDTHRRRLEPGHQASAGRNASQRDRRWGLQRYQFGQQPGLEWHLGTTFQGRSCRPRAFGQLPQHRPGLGRLRGRLRRWRAR